MSFALSLILIAAAPPSETVEVHTESLEITVQEPQEELPLPDCLALPCPEPEVGADATIDYGNEWDLPPEGPQPWDTAEHGHDGADDADDEREPIELEIEGAYFSMGVGPIVTFVPSGFYPGARYEAELGFVVEPAKLDRRGLWVGAHGYLDHYFGRKRVAGGLDIVLTKQLGPMYIRGGLGTAAGLPRYNPADKVSPGVGGVIGLGLMGGDEVYGRVGVDYNIRLGESFEITHTVMLTLNLAFGP